MLGQELARGIVEGQGTQGSRLVGTAEMLVVVIDAVAQGDCHRVVDDAVGPGGLGRSLMQCEECGFGYPAKMTAVDG